MTLTRQTRTKSAFEMGDIYSTDGRFITSKPKWHARLFFKGMLEQDGKNFIWIPWNKDNIDLTWYKVNAKS